MSIAMNIPVVIYKMVADGVCEYVGRTCNPASRRDTHLRNWNTEGNLEFVEIEVVDKADAPRAERKWIRHYRALGQALRNKHIGERAERTRIPVLIRADYCQALKIRAALERKKIYEVAEEILWPQIEQYRSVTVEAPNTAER